MIRKKSSVASLRKEGIFLEFTDITNTSICMSFALTLFTIPNNLLSYFAEWNSNFLPAVYNHLNMNLKIGMFPMRCFIDLKGHILIAFKNKRISGN